MFCSCLNETWKIGQEDLPPNKNVCPVCLAHPGTLPVPNVEAIKAVIKAGLALNCQIAEKSKFDRNNIFIPTSLKVIKFPNMMSHCVRTDLLKLIIKKLALLEYTLKKILVNFPMFLMELWLILIAPAYL